MTTPTIDQLIEQAIQGHAGTRDAMRWLVAQVTKAPASSTTPTREQVIEWLIASGFPNMICVNLSDQDHQRMSSFATIAMSAGREQGLREANVLREILGDCYNVIYTIDPEDGDEAEQLREILESIERATSPIAETLI